MAKKYAPSVSVIIPTLNAGNAMSELLSRLHKQTIPATEIIVIDSASTDETVEICQNDRSVTLIPIRRDAFDHGKTRDFAIRRSSGEIVVLLTQDAIPVSEDFLEKLVAPLASETVAISTGRQISGKNANRAERLVRLYNYPVKSHLRSREDLPQMGIKTFFCSNVCAAYQKELYFLLGGFDYPVKTNEDMFFAAKAINSGFQIAYAADAMVFHSHSFTLKEQFARNCLQGYEMERHKKLLGKVRPEPEGTRMFRYVSGELLKRVHVVAFLRFCLDCAARFSGNRVGRRAYIREQKKQQIIC